MYPNDLRRGRSCVFLLHVHLVFVTKYRRAIFGRDHREAMKSVFEAGYSTADLSAKDTHPKILSTTEFGDRVMQELDRLLAAT